MNQSEITQYAVHFYSPQTPRKREILLSIKALVEVKETTNTLIFVLMIANDCTDASSIKIPTPLNCIVFMSRMLRTENVIENILRERVLLIT